MSWRDRLTTLKARTGFIAVEEAPADAKLLFAQRFVRLFAYGASTIVLASFLSDLDTSDFRIGLFMTLTLLGDVLLSLMLTLFADGIGRRRTLAAGCALMAASGAVFALSSNYWVLLLASVFGVISPSGNEIGPFRAIEESTLAQLTPADVRSDVFAWYTLCGSAGAAAGSLLAGGMVRGLREWAELGPVMSQRWVWVVYAALGVVKLLLATKLSAECEPERKEQGEYHELGGEDTEVEEEEGAATEEEALAPEGHTAVAEEEAEVRAPAKEEKKGSLWARVAELLPEITAESRPVIAKLCMLFAVDSFASGLVSQSWLTYYFLMVHNLTEDVLGTIFFSSSIVAAASNLVAASLAKSIGLVKTMVFTHLPSAIFLALIPLPSQTWLAAMLLVLRSCTSTMDQAPRQAFLSAVVQPGERTAVMGVVNIVKTLMQSVGPSLTGYLAGVGRFWIAFVVAGALKASYDLALLGMFLGHKV